MKNKKIKRMVAFAWEFPVFFVCCIVLGLFLVVASPYLALRVALDESY